MLATLVARFCRISLLAGLGLASYKPKETE